MKDLNLRFIYYRSNAKDVEEVVEDVYAAAIDEGSEVCTENLDAIIKDNEYAKGASSLVDMNFNGGILKPGQTMIIKFVIRVKHLDEERNVFPYANFAMAYTNGQAISKMSFPDKLEGQPD